MTYVPVQIKRQVIQRATDCCEYCRLSQEDYPFSFHMEHVISEKHDGPTTLENLALSCPTCNSFKGSDIAGADKETGKPVFLYNPRKQKWEDHFVIVNMLIEGKTPEGKLAVRLLQLNHTDRLTSRALLIKLGRFPC